MSIKVIVFVEMRSEKDILLSLFSLRRLFCLLVDALGAFHDGGLLGLLLDLFEYLLLLGFSLLLL